MLFNKVEDLQNEPKPLIEADKASLIHLSPKKW